MSETVIVKRDGAIAILMFNRPEVLNAFNDEVMEQFTSALVALAVDNAVRGIVISGEGRAFSAGGDLKWVLGLPQGPVAGFHTLAATLHGAVLEIRRMGKPVIAAVNGIAAGAGFSIAMSCDFRVMAESAVFRQSYTSSGLSIDGGGTYALPRLVGIARSLEIAAFDEPIDSKKALDWGLATKVVPDGTSVEEAVVMAKRVATGSLEAFGQCKQLLTDSFDTAFETHIERERAALRHCASHPDGREGLKAFKEKRKPVFGK